MDYLEYTGYLASLLVAVSLMMSSIIRLRWVNTAGSLTFVVYGLLIQAYPVALMNFFIVGINAYYLRQMYRKEEYFKILPLNAANSYYQEFLAFHRAEISTRYPGFQLSEGSGRLRYLILRDLAVAGVFVGTPQPDGSLRVDLDYVVPAYRDFKPGRFLYHAAHSPLKQQHFSRIWVHVQTREQEKYFRRMGFRPSRNDAQLLVMHAAA